MSKIGIKPFVAVFAVLFVVACQGDGSGGLNTGQPTTTEPADSVLNPGDEIAITMGYKVDAQKVTAENISFDCQGEGIDDGPVPIDVVYNSSAGKINIVPTQPLVSGTDCTVTFGPELNAAIDSAKQSGLEPGQYLGRVAGNRPQLYTPPSQEPTLGEGDATTPESINQVISWGFSVSSSAGGSAPAAAPSGNAGDGAGEGSGEEPGSGDGWDIEGL